MGYATKAPIKPVPIISPNNPASIFLNFLYKTPDKNAPIILPGKAKRLPVPKIFLSVEAYPGPNVTAVTTFIKCCTGDILAPNIGIENVPNIVAIAISTPLNANFFDNPFFSIFTSNSLKKRSLIGLRK